MSRKITEEYTISIKSSEILRLIFVSVDQIYQFFWSSQTISVYLLGCTEKFCGVQVPHSYQSGTY